MAIGALRRSVLALEPNIPLAGAVRTSGFGFRSMQDEISGSLAPRRFSMFLLGLFALAAAVLSVIGIYGVTSYIVALRTREIAVRMALGARPDSVIRQVLGQGMRLVGLGMAIGLGVAWALSRLMTSLLYDVRPRDPLTFAAAAFLFAGVSFVASYVPARRVTSVDPMIALRSE
jgi:ABC-type antimicrobial peptide transport system permease subunit